MNSDILQPNNSPHNRMENGISEPAHSKHIPADATHEDLFVPGSGRESSFTMSRPSPNRATAGRRRSG